MDRTYPKPLKIHWVTTPDSAEFTLLTHSLTHSSIVALDAEWKPVHSQPNDPTQKRTFPTVSLLQLACRLVQSPPNSAESTDSVVFLVDLQSLPLNSIYGYLKEMLVSQNVLKLGFKFKQDLVYLCSTFCSLGCEPGFDKVEPYIDISSIYHHIQQRQPGRRVSKDNKSLATICKELLGVALSKELQCSDWSLRPLTEDQKTYAAVDAHCLLDLFTVFQLKVDNEAADSTTNDDDALGFPNLNLGLKEILEKPSACKRIVSSIVSEASYLLRATIAPQFLQDDPSTGAIPSNSFCGDAIPFDVSLSRIISKYSTKIFLKEADKKPRTAKKKGKKPSSLNQLAKNATCIDNWQGPAPWDLVNGGDGCPKFLCDLMVEGLAKHLRCMESSCLSARFSCYAERLSLIFTDPIFFRELIEQALKEKRVILTRDAKLLRHEYLIENQIYRVKSLLKNEQLLEIIQTFQLNISENQLMSRCTKCNGRFIQKPLTTEETVQAAKGFQKIPNCLFNKSLEFWQCMDCNQLYWEGTQYHNTAQKFVDICNLSE